jgi:PAS domain S-box-containing protein
VDTSRDKKNLWKGMAKAINSRAISGRFWVRAALWTGIVSLFLIVSVYFALKETREVALNQARGLFLIERTYRLGIIQAGNNISPEAGRPGDKPKPLWTQDKQAANHSGVRDIPTNHAVLKQMGLSMGHRLHFSTLDPVRPEDASDEWEKQALVELNSGRPETYGQTTMDGQPSLRYMGPVKAKDGCMLCHGGKEVPREDVVGGMSLAIPVGSFWTIVTQSHHLAFESALAVLWSIGLCVLLLSVRREKAFQKANKIAEESLQDSEEKFRTVADYTYAWEAWETQGGVLLYCSPSCERITGYPPEAFMSDPGLLERLIHPDELPRWKAHFSTSHGPLGMKEDMAMENIRILRPDGETRWIDHTCHPIFDRQGHYKGRRISNRDVTMRKKAEIALEASEEKYSKVYHLSPDAIDLTHLETGIQVETNQSYVNMFGYTREELIGHSTLPGDLGLWVDKEDRDRLIATIKEHGEVREFETLLRGKDGNILNILISSSLLEIGGERYNLSICRNITGRKSAEKRLTLSEEKFAKIYYLSPDAIDLTNLENSLHVEINPAHEKMFGYTREEIIGHTALPEDLDMWLKKEDRERFIAMFKESGEVLGFEASMRRKGGDIFNAILSTSIVEIQGERCLLTICRDISERKQAEVALQASEEKYSKTFQSAPLLIALSRLENGQLIDVNDIYCQTLQFTREELIGRTTIELGIIRKEDRERLTEIVKINGNAKNLEFKLIPKNGNSISCLFSGETVLVGDDKLLISMVTDITELKRAEEHDRKLEAKLQQAQKMESLGTLVAGVAHNINNVLAIIMGTASFREQSATEPSDLKAYKTIGRACARGRDVVRSLVQFAKPTISNQAPFELHELIQELCTLLGNTTSNRIKIIETFAAEPLWINGDAGTFNHALLNLSINSVDAMPNGGTLTFQTHILKEDWVEVSVIDSGEGIAQEVLGNVMDPFFTTKEENKGTGLGLSMTYGVIKAHGGTIDITSQPGQGTLVKIRIPRIPAPEQGESVYAALPFLGSVTVFLVDDDKDVRFLMAQMLKQAGVLRVKTFPGGKEALESLRSGELPDLIILDQNMPGLNGTQTMEGIRSLHPDLPILISSGQPDIEELDCFKQPRVAVISKPFTMVEIQTKLAQFAHEPTPGA